MSKSSDQSISSPMRPKFLLICIAATMLVSLVIFPGCADTSSSAPKPLPLEVTNKDGSVTLNSYLPEHLIGHLRDTIVKQQGDLIFTQLLSDQMKELYTQRGHDPHEAVAWLLKNSSDVLNLLDRLSAGINSPGVVWHDDGTVIELHFVSDPNSNLRFRTLEVIRQNGQFRLLTIR